MSRKRLYLIVGITAIVTIGFFLAAYIVSRQENQTPGTEPVNPFANFFPFGKSMGNGDRPISEEGTPTANTGTNGGENTPLINPKNLLALRQISTTATAGTYPFIKSGKTAVQFVERSTGNIYETTIEDMRRDRISNTLIPSAYETLSGNGGKTITYRYIKEGGSSITTFVRNVPNPDRVKIETQNATTSQTGGSFLEEGILHAFISSDTKSMFYLTKTPDFNTRTTVGSVFNFQKNTSTRVFQSPFSEWLPVSFDGKTVMLQTKASRDVPGFLYSMNVSNGELQKVLGDINGLTALPSPDQQKILYSESTRGGVALRIYSRVEKTTRNIELSTLPEKCVWDIGGIMIYCAAPDYIPTAEYPDAWYQGGILFSDAMWKIDPKTGNMEAVFLPSAFDAGNLDMTKPVLSPNGDYLFFINKTDSTLWGYSFPH
jgi:hypothetical protein